MTFRAPIITPLLQLLNPTQSRAIPNFQIGSIKQVRDIHYNVQEQLLKFNRYLEVPENFIGSEAHEKWLGHFTAPYGEFHRSLLIYRDIGAAQQWELFGKLGAETTKLWHAIYTNDHERYEKILSEIQGYSSKLQIGSNGLLAKASRKKLEEELPGILQFKEIGKRLERSPVITPEMISGAQNELFDVTTPITMLESLAIYHRIHKGYYAGDFGLEPHEVLMIGFRGFYELFSLERLYAQLTGKPVNFDMMLERIVEFNRMNEMGKSRKYPDLTFDNLGCLPFSLSIYASWESNWTALRPVLDVTKKGCLANPSPSKWDQVAQLLIKDPHKMSEIIEKRTREIIFGKRMMFQSKDPYEIMLDTLAGYLALNKKPLHSIATFNQVYWGPIYSIAPKHRVPVQDFSFTATLEKPLQSRINNGVIETYRNTILQLATEESQLEWIAHLLINGKQYGLKKLKPIIDKYKNEITEPHILMEVFKKKNIDIDLLLDELLKGIEKLMTDNQRSGLQVLPKLIVLKAIRLNSNTDFLVSIKRYRTSMPAEEALKSLSLLYEFYADQVYHISQKYFGTEYLNGNNGGTQTFLTQAVQRLGHEIEKVHFEVYGNGTLRFLPSRNALDVHHAAAGDRNCLINDYNLRAYSLTDPRTNFYRILLESIERDGEVSEPPAHEIWRGGLYQITHHYNGLKIMILTGIDPQIDFHVNSGDLMNGIEKNFGRIARENGYDMVLVHDFEGSSRKGTVLKEIHSRYTVPFVLPDEEAVGFPLKVPYGDRTGDNDRDYFMMHKTFLVMHDFRDEK